MYDHDKDHEGTGTPVGAVPRPMFYLPWFSRLMPTSPCLEVAGASRGYAIPSPKLEAEHSIICHPRSDIPQTQSRRLHRHIGPHIVTTIRVALSEPWDEANITIAKDILAAVLTNLPDGADGISVRRL
jgi:hypothetical protein